MEGTQRDSKALMVDRIQLFQNRPTWRSVHNAGGFKSVLLMEMNTDRLRGGEVEAVLRHPLLNAVYTQLHSSLLSV